MHKPSMEGRVTGRINTQSKTQKLPVTERKNKTLRPVQTRADKQRCWGSSPGRECRDPPFTARSKNTNNAETALRTHVPE